MRIVNNSCNWTSGTIDRPNVISPITDEELTKNFMCESRNKTVRSLMLRFRNSGSCCAYSSIKQSCARQKSCDRPESRISLTDVAVSAVCCCATTWMDNHIRRKESSPLQTPYVIVVSNGLEFVPRHTQKWNHTVCMKTCELQVIS